MTVDNELYIYIVVTTSKELKLTGKYWIDDNIHIYGSIYDKRIRKES